MSGHQSGCALSQDKLNFGKCLCSVKGSRSSLDWAAESCGNYHKTLHFIIHLVTFTKCVFINIRREGLGAPSRLHPAHRCSGVHDVGVTSPAPTGPHLTFTIFCLETAWRSVPVEADCPDPCLCRASRRIHNSYWFPPTDFIIHSHIVPSLVDKSSSFPCMWKCMNLRRRITQVLPNPAG